MKHSSSKKRPPKLAHRVLAGVGGLVTLSWLILRMTQHPLERDAATALAALLNGDGQRLYTFAHPEELETLLLTDQRWLAVWREHVNPRMSRVVKHDAITVVSDRRRYATASANVQLPNGRACEVSVIVESVEGRGKFSLVRSALAQAWIVEHAGSLDRPMALDDTNRACLVGLQRDRLRLESLGVTQWWVDPMTGTRPLAEVERRLMIAQASNPP